MLFHRTLKVCLVIVLSFCTWLLLPQIINHALPTANASVGSWDPTLYFNNSATNEPLLGGQLNYEIVVGVTGDDAPPRITDKVYNITISDTLPMMLTYKGASPSPTRIHKNKDGSTTLYWDNIADLNVNDSLSVKVSTVISNSASAASALVNSAMLAASQAPDNSAGQLTKSASVISYPAYIDIRKSVYQSTWGKQATGASGWESVAPGTDNSTAQWPFYYQLTVQNNNVLSTTGVVVTDVLPSSIAYMGGAVPTPTAVLTGPNNSIQLVWNLGDLYTNAYAVPRVITVPVAVPYAKRSGFSPSADCVRIPNTVTPADPGCFNGEPIQNATSIVNDDYNVTGYTLGYTLGWQPVKDGSILSPAGDPAIGITAQYLVLAKTEDKSTVGINSIISYTLHYFVSEYYTLTNNVITDVLGDGLRYVPGSSTISPTSVSYDSSTGLTTIVMPVPATSTTPGRAGIVQLAARVQSTYHDGTPIVANDNLSNNAAMASDWTDAVDLARNGQRIYGTGVASAGYAASATRLPTLSKQVWDPDTQQFIDGPIAAGPGKMLHFRIMLNAPSDIDVKYAVLQDYLPRGMVVISLTGASSTYAARFGPSASYFQTPTLPVSSTLYGLNILTWDFGFITQTAVFSAEYDALLMNTPDVEDGVIVANFAKFSASGTNNNTYSLRSQTDLDEVEPHLVLSKSATPTTLLNGGQVITYAYTIGNDSDAPAYQLVVTDSTPYGIKVPADCGQTDATPQIATCSADAAAQSGAGGVLTWTPIYAAGGLYSTTQQVFTYTAIISPGTPAHLDLINLASVSYYGQPIGVNSRRFYSATDDLEDDNTDAVTLTTDIPTIVKTSSPAVVTYGDTITYTLQGQHPIRAIAPRRRACGYD